ncbi:unnamed protein product [Cylicostephanus goldi]|uniref:PPM-type phosphatase domain-containing protein n=1 Tax=Cylicostephanus goldi TaxID=71465 RepID=A0A3P6SEB7_CYLGO|nr:unnamed protein product [Cylicostephanus goldi]
MCDENLCKAALPDNRGQIDRLSVATAAAGSCATLAHVRKGNLHVANVGDGAAVLGVVNPSGNVIARQLSRAHCIDNADEVQRIRSEHPMYETHILRGGRLLGELYPLRAFGDVRFKWPLDLQKVVLEPMGSPAPPHLHTPPYLSVSPEVFYHKLTPNDKFLVIATDGLWEWLDPDTVVRLVHDHTLGTMTLQPYQPKNGITLKQVMMDILERRIGAKSHKKPIDENCATHIIRHALGGVSGGESKQYERLIDILQRIYVSVFYIARCTQPRAFCLRSFYLTKFDKVGARLADRGRATKAASLSRLSLPTGPLAMLLHAVPGPVVHRGGSTAFILQLIACFCSRTRVDLM